MDWIEFMRAGMTYVTRATLARSPSFAMSLSAEELFHTNFLGFLLESEDEQLEDVRRALRSALEFASVVL
ncbi:hypothetical protein RD110_21910 [Rhodoferax koreense]|uniref:Uncharacterized protein n=1 Tax=Rhodoferax koreensis TaxID=1842727 RepID=A0A1P8K0R7_9BURK|nr:hypothetical protein [Rhodoferax koreense]APW39541.1 hypothetical protein RD110_21910 [Rhodoferax koreense]